MSRFSTTISDRPIVVVAGEASGDRLASHVLAHVESPVFGIGGDALASRGVDLVAHLRSFSAMGFTSVVPRIASITRATAALRSSVLARQPRAALLVDFTELNARIGAWLRSHGVHVVWLVAPQVWAWRSGRVATMGRSIDQLAALFPFEVRRWRDAGVRTTWVGHPAADEARRASMSVTSFAPSSCELPSDFRGEHQPLPLLPGSRAAEVRSLLPLMLDASDKLARGANVQPVVMLASSLDPPTSAWARDLIRSRRTVVCTVDADVGLAPLLAALRSRGATRAICASGTATLECALAGVAPVIVYRTDRISALIAKALLEVDEIGLPNVVLGRRVFPELLQDAATPDAVANAVMSLDHRVGSFDDLAHLLRAQLTPSDDHSFGARVAMMLGPARVDMSLRGT